MKLRLWLHQFGWHDWHWLAWFTQLGDKCGLFDPRSPGERSQERYLDVCCVCGIERSRVKPEPYYL